MGRRPHHGLRFLPAHRHGRGEYTKDGTTARRQARGFGAGFWVFAVIFAMILLLVLFAGVIIMLLFTWILLREYNFMK